MTARSLRLAAVGLAALMLGLWALDVARQLQLGVADSGLAFNAVAGVATVVVSVAVAVQPGRERMALVMAVWLFASVLDDLAVEWPVSRSAATLWMLAHGLAPAAYGLMVLAYPSGRLRARGERVLVALTAFVGILWMGTPMLFFSGGGCASCVPRVSSWLYTGTTFDYARAGQVYWSAFIAVGVAFVALLMQRLRAAPPGARVTLVPLGLAVFFTAAEFVVQRVVWLGGWQSPGTALDWIDRANALLLPLAIFVGLLAIRRRRGPLGDLVVELGQARPGEVGRALARTLGDSTLELALWLPERREFVDEAGERLDTSNLPEGRALTAIGSPGEPLAALIHDERLLGQRPLLEAAGSAARLALENTRLQAALRAQLAELQASRARIVGAADAERRRLERDLHDGAQQRLLALGLALQLLRDGSGDQELLVQAEAELQTALSELRDLARGIHPTILSEQGLGPAVRSLCDRAPVPVHLEADDERYPVSVETTVYFVVAEALANIAKHARAHSAAVSLARENGKLLVDISDDGRGGATARTGSGLQGLVDRVAAVGGTLTIASQPGAGTTLHAEVPCDS
ncbi:MAG TPA: histidine kinase [Gaiellaceae bacterium]|nr:histidine kinase [Gaiellaceae bacterium]